MRRLAPVLFAMVACSSKQDDAPPPRAPVSLTASDYTLTVDLDAKSVTLARAGTVLAQLPQDGLALGTRDTVDDSGNYDPYAIYAPTGLSPTPEDLVWLVPDRFDVASATSSAIDLDLTYPQGTKARLHFEQGKAPGAFAAKLTPTGDKLAYVRLRAKTDAQEGYYGLGEYFDDVNHRGHVRAMQIEVDGELESSYNEAHVPIPLLIGTRGWGLFVDDPHPGVFAVATEAPDRVDAAFGTGMVTNKGLSFHLFATQHPLDVTKHYYDLTGYPLIPARWALGPWIWRDENKDQVEFEKDLNDARDLDVATTAWWIDRPYATGVQTFDFDPKKFTDGKKAIELAHDLGYRVALWHVPYLDEKDPNTQALRDEANSKKYYPLQNGLLLNKWGKPIDLTNPAAFAWWQSLIEKYTVDAGIEGFKLDYGEDVVPGIGSARNVWRFSDGSDERTMHGGFQLFYHRAYAEKLPKDGGFLLCRHATTGDQKNVSVIWPGDLDANFATHWQKIDDGKDKYTAVGGLPASVIAGLSLGPSGYPFFGADTGGYRRSPATKECMTRWFEQTALSSVMQVGNNASQLPWETTGGGWDAEMLGFYKTYARLHLRLFPYEWTYAQQIAKTGRPIQRALGLVYPELGVHPNDEYLFGDHLLVAPVVEAGKTSRSVTFPKGRWIGWWDGVAHEAGSANVDAPLGTLPLYLEEGGTVPMLRPTIDAIAPTKSPDRVDSYATSPGVLWARVAPAETEAKFVLFDGATIGHVRAGAKITLKSADGSEFKNGVVFELVGQKKPASVSEGAEVADLAALDAATNGWTWTSEAGGTLYVKVAPGTHEVTVQ
ncbi:MAG: glycoside hydrolase family 31 protein [Polyangiales bacterium]